MADIQFGTYTYLAKITTAAQGKDAMRGVVDVYQNAANTYKSACDKLESANKDYQNAFSLYSQNSNKFREIEDALDRALVEYEQARDKFNEAQEQVVEVYQAVTSYSRKDTISSDITNFEAQIKEVNDSLEGYIEEIDENDDTQENASLGISIMSLGMGQMRIVEDDTPSGTTTTTTNNSAIPDRYQADSWEDVKITEEPHYIRRQGQKIKTGTSYYYTASDGTKITLPSKDGAIIKRNKNTGEIAIINAKEGTTATLGNNAKVVIENSQIKDITSNGAATININGEYTNVAKITGTKGAQTINIKNGAHVEQITTGDYIDKINLYSGAVLTKATTGKGNDTVYSDSSTIGTIDTGDGDDYVTITKSTVTGDIKTGKDNDTVNIIGSTVYKNIDTGKGNDSVTITAATNRGGKIEAKSTINGTVTGGTSGTNSVSVNNAAINGSLTNFDNITIKNTTLSQGGTIYTGYGDVKVDIENSNLQGSLNFNQYYLSADVTVENSSVANTTGLQNADYTKLNITNSTVKGIEHLIHSNDTGYGVIEPQANTTINVTPLNTSKGGEYEGFVLLKPEQNKENEMVVIKYATGDTATMSRSDYEEGFYPGTFIVGTYYENVYRLSNGTTIRMDNTNGQVYQNPTTGQIVVNCAVNASISSKANIKVVNSSISSQTVMGGDVTYQGSTVNSINVLRSTGNANINLDSSSVTNINAQGEFCLNLNNNSTVTNCTANGTSTVYVGGNSGSITNLKGTGDATIRFSIPQNSNVKINSVEVENGWISGDIQNATITNILSTSGRINLKAQDVLSHQSQIKQKTVCLLI